MKDIRPPPGSVIYYKIIHRSGFYLPWQIQIIKQESIELSVRGVDPKLCQLRSYQPSITGGHPLATPIHIPHFPTVSLFYVLKYFSSVLNGATS